MTTYQTKLFGWSCAGLASGLQSRTKMSVHCTPDGAYVDTTIDFVTHQITVLAYTNDDTVRDHIVRTIHASLDDMRTMHRKMRTRVVTPRDAIRAMPYTKCTRYTFTSQASPFKVVRLNVTDVERGPRRRLALTPPSSASMSSEAAPPVRAA